MGDEAILNTDTYIKNAGNVESEILSLFSQKNLDRINLEHVVNAINQLLTNVSESVQANKRNYSALENQSFGAIKDIKSKFLPNELEKVYLGLITLFEQKSYFSYNPFIVAVSCLEITSARTLKLNNITPELESKAKIYGPIISEIVDTHVSLLRKKEETELSLATSHPFRHTDFYKAYYNFEKAIRVLNNVPEEGNDSWIVAYQFWKGIGEYEVSKELKEKIEKTGLLVQSTFRRLISSQ